MTALRTAHCVDHVVGLSKDGLPRQLHSLKLAPDDVVLKVSSQVVEDVPANIPRALLAEYITEMILGRSPQIGTQAALT